MIGLLLAIALSSSAYAAPSITFNSPQAGYLWDDFKINVTTNTSASCTYSINQTLGGALVIQGSLGTGTSHQASVSYSALPRAKNLTIYVSCDAGGTAKASRQILSDLKCQDAIGTDWTLGHDLACNSTAAPVLTFSGAYSLDCAGHSITGSRSTGYIIFNESTPSGYSVENCAISNAGVVFWATQTTASYTMQNNVIDNINAALQITNDAPGGTASSILFQNNTITNAEFGLIISGLCGSTIRDNTFTDLTEGAVRIKSDDATLLDCQSDRNLIQDNTFQGISSSAIHLWFTSYAEIIDNVISLSGDAKGILISAGDAESVGTAGHTISGNTIEGGSSSLYLYYFGGSGNANSNITGLNLTGNIFNSALNAVYSSTRLINPVITKNQFLNAGMESLFSGIGPLELSFNGEGNYWGHDDCSFLGSAMIPGADSNSTDIVDSYAYLTPEFRPRCYFNASISIISPQAIVYHNHTLLVNLSSSNANSVWFHNGSATEPYTTPAYRTFKEGKTTITAYANDTYGDVNQTSVSFTIDTQPPEISDPYPSGEAYTTSEFITISVETDEDAECRFSDLDLPYDEMENNFSSHGDEHSEAYPVSVGNSYVIYVRCVDEYGFNNTESAVISFNVTDVPPDGGGDIGAAPPVASTDPVETRVWSQIEANQVQTVRISRGDFALTELEFVLLNPAGPSRIDVTKLSTLPADVSRINEGVIYDYFSVTATGIKISDIQGMATLRFRVSRSWLIGNNIDASTVTLMHYEDGQWTKLGAVFFSSDDNYSYYESTTPGFSYFAVVGRRMPEQNQLQEDQGSVGLGSDSESPQPRTPEVEEEKTMPGVQLDIPDEGSNLPLIIGSAIVIAVVLAGAGMFAYNKYFAKKGTTEKVSGYGFDPDQVMGLPPNAEASASAPSQGSPPPHPQDTMRNAISECEEHINKKDLAKAIQSYSKALAIYNEDHSKGAYNEAVYAILSSLHARMAELSQEKR
ncbi:PGF-pre-PGF domain-containing protein [Candidatus Woesearchaeota archaeon]|nr:PGF-pre-PGF domain-containing protein [Candidatus Woesearchaeota archaeon]